MKIYRLFLLVFLYVLASSIQAQEARLLRFPAIHGNQVVFTYAGNLYTVSATGGIARKLTDAVGFEMFARFSPDGKYLAFTGQYDGNTEVYLMPAEGGVPKRLTWTATLGRDDVSDRMGPNNIVMAWKHKSKEIVFRSRMNSFNSFNGQLFSVDLKGDLPQELPLPRGGFCSFSPDDSQMAYNRIFREFRTWKRYRGGMADDIWIYDFASKKIRNITKNPAQDIIPMWHGKNIYFLSDRDAKKRMNLYVYNLESKKTRKLTNFSNFDIKFPSLGVKAIVFENGGYIYRYDLKTEKCRKIPIQIKEDFSQGRNKLINVSGYITGYDIAPDGKRALFGARGDIFSVPARHGAIRNLTSSPGIHERNAVWSPDGKWIAYISDASGEDEIYILPQDGKEKAQQITHNEDTYKYALAWSPDSRKILWADKRLRLRYVSIKSRQITEVDKSDVWEFSQYSWSPDSRWIVYVKPEKAMDRIYIYSLSEEKAHAVTDGWYEVSNPVFSNNGKYLFFVSNRDFNPIYSWVEWNYAYLDMSRIYLVTLTRKVDSPFKPQSDEVAIKDKSAQAEKTADKTNSPKSKTQASESKGKPIQEESLRVQVDFEGIQDRVVQLPIKASRYFNLAAAGDTVYYLRNGHKDNNTQLLMYNLKDKKETSLGTAGSFAISADGKKMLVSRGNQYAIIDLPKAPVAMKHTMDLSGMKVFLDRHKEWAQIYREVWRQMREFFHVPNMNGVDWRAMRDRYLPLVQYVNNRADLTYILGELVGELNSGHCYVGGGDYPQPARIKLGLLGAEIERDPDSGYYRIKKILRGQNWDKTLRSPLTAIGVDAREGDYLLEIDGKPLKGINNFNKLLIDKAGKQVTLKLNSKPTEKGSHSVIVVPTSDVSELYYYEWVENNIKKVNKATDGKVGYIHVPDMGRKGLNEFVKHFYPQIRKKGLIIDVRGNGGGNVSPMLIERLRRKIAMIDFARNTAPHTDPEAMIYGPMVCLADEFSASDGDLFTYRFKKYKLGKVIGKRTWGGVVGIRGSLPLLDGGYVNKPEFSRYDVEGKKWIIEGYGVEPDIFVDNDPALEYAGIDQQLNKAIEVILKELKTKEKEIPPLPPYPVK